METLSKSSADRQDQAPSVSEKEEEEEAEEILETRELEELQARLAAEQDSLVAEMSKAERLSSSITDQMYSECQQLLQMFGLPWLVVTDQVRANRAGSSV